MCRIVHDFKGFIGIGGTLLLILDGLLPLACFFLAVSVLLIEQMEMVCTNIGFPDGDFPWRGFNNVGRPFSIEKDIAEGMPMWKL